MEKIKSCADCFFLVRQMNHWKKSKNLTLYCRTILAVIFFLLRSLDVFFRDERKVVADVDVMHLYSNLNCISLVTVNLSFEKHLADALRLLDSSNVVLSLGNLQHKSYSI